MWLCLQIHKRKPPYMQVLVKVGTLGQHVLKISQPLHKAAPQCPFVAPSPRLLLGTWAIFLPSPDRGCEFSGAMVMRFPTDF